MSRFAQTSADKRNEKELEKNKARSSWKPAQVLSLGGKKPEGMRLRHCRVGSENLAKKMEEGWVFVHEKDGVFINGGTNVEGAVRKMDVVLMMMPEEMAAQRELYFKEKAQAQATGQNMDSAGNLVGGEDAFEREAAAAGLPTHGDIRET